MSVWGPMNMAGRFFSEVFKRHTEDDAEQVVIVGAIGTIPDLRHVDVGMSASAARIAEWLPHKDSNLNKQIQNLRCYHYTMRQWGENGT